MIENISILKKSGLFNGISDVEFDGLLKSLSAQKINCKSGEYLFHGGDKTDCIGLLLSGRLMIERGDFWGNNNIISEISQGELFAESFAVVPDSMLSVNVISLENSEILLLNIKNIMSTNNISEITNSKLIGNLLRIIAQRNLMLNEKLSHITKRTTKQKLMSYLSAQSQKSGSNEFTIPYNRQQLADYLSVERSAMSNELCKLRDEGILSFHKNNFTLHTNI